MTVNYQEMDILPVVDFNIFELVNMTIPDNLTSNFVQVLRKSWPTPYLQLYKNHDKKELFARGETISWIILMNCKN